MRAAPAATDALVDYVKCPDASFAWEVTEKRNVKGGRSERLNLVSQTWRGMRWDHEMLLVWPQKIRSPDIALLLVSGDGAVDKQFDVLRLLADRAGGVAAIINRVPNQPLFGDKKEDAIIAYTFSEYLRTGDRTWPALFPMVKSAVRGMDAIQAAVEKETGAKVRRFLVTGASKRGWTTWLSGATDPRVCAIAPMVIDMLNMRVQTDWAAKMYGRATRSTITPRRGSLITWTIRGWWNCASG